MTPSHEATAARAVSTRSRRSRLLIVLVVCGGIAVGLRLLDQLPPWWLGQPRSPVSYASVQDFERQQRTRLLLPYVFPDTLVWPPDRVTLAPGKGRPVLIEFQRADGTGVGLVLAQVLDGDFPVPARLVAPVETAALPEPAGAPPLSRGTGRDGRPFLEVSDVVEGRRVVLRWYDADPAPLRRIARSLRRG